MDMASNNSTRFAVAFAIGMIGYFPTFAQALGAKLHHCMLTGKSIDSVEIYEVQPCADACDGKIAA